jgi:thymidylate kinase
MIEQHNIKTIAFEGLHRSGKGTQIEILNKKLEELGIPSIIIRGAGSRPNSDEHIGDPYSSWWEDHLKVLRSAGVKKEDWNDGSRRLARELIIFRDRVLPKLLIESGKKEAVLLIDRSILSHLAILNKEESKEVDMSRC